MPKIIVLGGGVCGLATGMMLARDGHEVTVLEKDSEAVPESLEQAWERWSRGGVTQFRLAHYLHPRGREVLETTLPHVADALEAAGGLRLNALNPLPPTITDREPRAGDERFTTITARRPALEQVIGRAAQAEPGVDVRRGVTVDALTTRTYNGTHHVTGVRTESGDALDADLVIDAMGRRSQLPRWLSECGAGTVHEDAEDSGFIYYSRFFRSADGHMPEFFAPPLTPIGTFSVLTIPSDNQTWSVTLYISTGDQPLKRLRHADRWKSVVAACPLHAHWLEGEPITDIQAMSGILDRYRRMTVDGEPVATGIAPVADAWASTNPSLGRGISLGLLHAQRLRDVVRDHLEDPRRFAETWDSVTEAELTPWYRETIEEDRARVREIDALRNGLQPPPPAESEGPLFGDLLAAAPRDPDLFRAFLASRCCLTPVGETLARPEVVERIVAVADDAPPMPFPGPDREQVLQLLG